MRTLEIYDTFRPKRLLEVKFELSNNPELIRTFRSSYYSIRQFYKGIMGEKDADKQTNNSRKR